MAENNNEHNTKPKVHHETKVHNTDHKDSNKGKTISYHYLRHYDRRCTWPCLFESSGFNFTKITSNVKNCKTTGLCK